MIRYKGFAFFIKDKTIFIIDPRNNQVLMIKDAKNIYNQIELGRSMIEQHISDMGKTNK